MRLSVQEAHVILGLDFPSKLPEVKSKFRKLAKKYHPDFNDEKDANEKFREIYEAYEMILRSFNEINADKEKQWFQKWKQTGFIKPEDDPFEIIYESYWIDKIARMQEFLKKK